MTSKCPPELRSAYHQHRLLLFIGAGVSRSVTWQANGVGYRGPSWEELVEEATKSLGFERPDLARVRGTDMQLLEYFKLKNAGQIAVLTNWLARVMTPGDDAIAAAPILNGIVALHEKCKSFYTTNYDDFLERAFKLKGVLTNSIVLARQMGRADGKVEIVKFHGDLNHPAEIVLTESDYEHRLALKSPLDSKLKADLLGRVVLFIGYSFRDPNVSYIFRTWQREHAKEESLRGNIKAYIALPDPSDFEYEMFRARQIEVIPLRAAQIDADVAGLLAELVR